MKVLSLRNQMLWPVLACVVMSQVTLIGVFGWLVARSQAQDILGRIEQVIETLTASNFPVTATVLDQMKGLTGAEFLLVNEAGIVVLATWSPPGSASQWLDSIPQRPAFGDLDQQITEIGGQPFYALSIFRPNPAGAASERLVVLFPQAKFKDRQWQAIRPVIGLGLLSLVGTIALVSWLATRVTRPIRELRNQVEQIAEGHYPELPVDSSTQEVRELAVTVQAMADRLSDYEAKILSSERLRLWALLRSGIAHQMRNALTGAKMAIEIHAGQCNRDQADESLQIALRQFKVIEQQLQQFLQSPTAGQLELKDLRIGQLLDGCRALVDPVAVHRQVPLVWEIQDKEAQVRGDTESLQQVLVNLIMNAVEATAQGVAAPQVSVRVAAQSPSKLVIQVWDNGPGPRESMVPQLFQPFATDKSGGVGLGLWMARQIVEQHGGRIVWFRKDSRTCFECQLLLTEN